MESESIRYEVGDEIEYDSLGGRRIVCVTGKFGDIKNGESGFDCVGSNGEQWWGYDYQIIRVVQRLRDN